LDSKAGIFMCFRSREKCAGRQVHKALGSWMGGEVNPNCSLPILG